MVWNRTVVHVVHLVILVTVHHKRISLPTKKTDLICVSDLGKFFPSTGEGSFDILNTLSSSSNLLIIEPKLSSSTNSFSVKHSLKGGPLLCLLVWKASNCTATCRAPCKDTGWLWNTASSNSLLFSESKNASFAIISLILFVKSGYAHLTKCFKSCANSGKGSFPFLILPLSRPLHNWVWFWGSNLA